MSFSRLLHLLILPGAALSLLTTPIDAQQSLVDDLRSDDIRWNAINAGSALLDAESPPIDELMLALDSDDWQQRQLAAQTLWRRAHPARWSRHAVREIPEQLRTPPPRLLAVSVEGLRSDALPYDPVADAYVTYFNAASGYRYLIRHAELAAPMLLEGLDSDDYQQRFLCALILAHGGVGSSAERVVPILAWHLRDNSIGEDAKWATHALYQLGQPARDPLLRIFQASDDSQQRTLITLLLLDLAQPPKARSELEARKLYNKIASGVWDPAVQGPIDDSMSWLHDLPKADPQRP